MGSLLDDRPNGEGTAPPRRSAAERLAAKRAVYADRDRPPVVLPPDLDGIPADLRAEPRWVLWKLEWVEKRRQWAKVPYQTIGRKAKPNDAATWAPFEAITVAYREHPAGWAGVGFMLGGGWVGVDLDGVRDPATGAIDPAAAELVGALGTYCEVSPSATGVKLFGQGEWRGSWHKKAFADGAEVEAYGDSRFFCATGIPTGPSGVTDIQVAADVLAERLAARPAHRRVSPPRPAPHRRSPLPTTG